MHDTAHQILEQLKSAWRYRWYAVFAAWLIALCGWAVVAKWPNRYEASARVYVDTQSVLKPLLAGIAVQPNVDQMVTMMSRTLISRPNVERVIRMADMDVKVRSAEEREALVTRLMKEVSIKSAGAENLYIITYSDQNPQQAKRVVESLLTIFVEGALGGKRKDSESAQRFINEQLKVYNDRLVSAEHAITEFKRRNMGLLGAGQQTYYTRLADAQTALNQAQLELKEAENSRDAVKKQLDGEELPSLLGAEPSDVDAPNPELDGRIQALEKKLDGLRLNYTERHPDIIATRRMIAQLKEEKKKEAKQKKARPAAAQQPRNLVHEQLTVALTEAEAAVASLKARVAEYARRYEALRAAANAIPQVEAQYTQLTRDYDVTKKNYDVLLARLESAQISGNMEATANVVDFRVIDPPVVPAKPSAPNRPLLMSLVFLAALGGGIAFALMVSQVRPTFSDEERLSEVSVLPIYGTVSMTWTAPELAKRRRGLLAFAGSYVGLVSAYAALMAALLMSTVRA